MSRPIVLCILDGWGIRKDNQYNGINPNAPHWMNFVHQYPYAELQASEIHVGLPCGQMGNSEVGHTCIGLGRTILQDLPKIDHAIEQRLIQNNPKFKTFVAALKQSKGAAHLLGLLSPGGVHSHQSHMIAMAKILMEENIPVVWHCFLDGRDTPPKSALNYMQEALLELGEHSFFQIGTIGGRYFGMDRDKRWDRVQSAYQAIVNGHAENSFDSPIAAIQHYYDLGTTDEFIPPLVIGDYTGMKNGDGLWMINFRSDRVRQILSSLLIPDFASFPRDKVIQFSSTLGMNEYADYLTAYIPPLFGRDNLNNGLGEVVSFAGDKQLRVAETEKYAHVTFFFNGGVETPFEGEDRIMIPSPQVATYDLMPEMSAATVCETVLKAMADHNHQLIVVNFANTDMVGHTGKQEAIARAVHVVDECVAKIVAAANALDWTILITADHGNAEEMIDEDGQPHTAHTLNPVPLLMVNGPEKTNLRNGVLADIAPTIISLLGYDKPMEMTGQSLLTP